MADPATADNKPPPPKFGAWFITPSSVGSSDGHIRSARSSIMNYNNGDPVSPGTTNHYYLNRVVMEMTNDSNGATGLVQAGMGITSSSVGLDDCGARTNTTSFVEYRRMSDPDTDTYECEWFGDAPRGTQKLYTVGKIDDYSVIGFLCDGCYDIQIDGDSKVHASIATSAGGGTNVDDVAASGEVGSKDSTGNGHFRFGYTGSGSYNWSWSRQQLDDSPTWHSVANSDVPYCWNNDYSFGIDHVFSQGNPITIGFTNTDCG